MRNFLFGARDFEYEPNRSNAINYRGLAPDGTEYLNLDDTTSWVAVLDWFGPHSTIDSAAAEAQRLCTEARKGRVANFQKSDDQDSGDEADFGLYLAIGRHKSFSILGPRLLYIGANRDAASKTLSERLSESLHSREENDGLVESRCCFYFALPFAPRLKLHHAASTDYQKKSVNEIFYSETSLIYGLNPVLNYDELKRPHFNFVIFNRLNANGKGKHIGWFNSLIPEAVELNLAEGDAGFLKYRWARNLRGPVQRRAPAKREPRNDSAENRIWRKWYMERFRPSVDQARAR